MQLQITGNNYEINDYARNLVNKKLITPLNKLLASFQQDLKKAHVKIEQRTRWGYKTIFHLQLAGKSLHAEAVNEDLSQALVNTREAMEKQIKKHMDKLRNR